MKTNKTGKDRLQDCCNNWSLNLDFCLYGCEKGCYCNFVIQSSNHQQSIEEKIRFIKHFCILYKNKDIKFLSLEVIKS